MTSACILGCAGPVLDEEEAAFFRDVQPWGFILFGRNIQSPDQVRTLTASLRACVGQPDAPILVDQEGGRVQRLTAPHWRRYPPARAFKERIGGPSARDVARLGARLIAHDLAAVGITVDCMPVLDIPAPGAHDIIGDRAYGETWSEVAVLGRAVAEGLIAGGVLPVIKHIPGHGRAEADSHLALPRVTAAYVDLDQRDIAAFRPLSDMPIAMTAHIVYEAIDPHRPATTSPTVIGEVIRHAIGFDGLLLSDDLSMKALSGDLADRARDAIAAGCDIVLHCNGDRGEMAAVARSAGDIGGAAQARAEAALARLPAEVEPIDLAQSVAAFEAAFAQARAA